MEYGKEPIFVTIGGNRFVIVGEFFLKLQPRALMDERPRMQIARMGGRASLGIHPGTVQIPGSQEGTSPTAPNELESPRDSAE